MTKRELAAKGRSATLEDLKSLDKDVTFLTPEYIAHIINVSAQWIRSMARDNPNALGFPTLVRNTRVYIPVPAFIKYVEGELNHA